MMNITGMKNDKRKNSLIELCRFLFALWVLYYHSFVPYKGALFGQGYLAVEFFFVLSGFFLLQSMEQYLQKSTKEGLGDFLKHRFKAIAIPFFIGEIFVLLYSFTIEISYNLFFGYLWYIRDLFIAMIGIFLLRKWIKSQRQFYVILAIISVVSFVGFSWLPIIAWPRGPFRSAAAIPLGIFASLLPKFSGKKKSHGIYIGIGTILSALGCLSIAVLQDKTLLLSYVLVVVGYPALIYFMNQIKFSSPLFNWLGSLSFPIYAFQCILRVVEAWGFENNIWLFIILMILVLTYSLATHIVKSKSRNKKE